MCVGCPETVERETTGKTSHGTEKTLESLGHVMRDEVFVHLHHSDDRLFGIGQLRFTTNAEQLLVVDHTDENDIRIVTVKRKDTYADNSRLRENGATVVSASTMNKYS